MRHAIHTPRTVRILLVVASSALALTACRDGGSGPPPPPGVISLAVGQGLTLSSSQATTIEVSGGSAGAEFVLIPFYTSQAPQSTVTLEFSGTQLTTVAGPPLPALAPARDATLSVERVASLQARDAARARFDAELRRLERDVLGRRMAAARAARSLRASRSAAGSGSLAPVPAVGDQLTFNVSRTACLAGSEDMRTGRVAAVTQRAIIVADIQNPAGGFDDTEYGEIAQQFDSFVYPLDVLNFGAPEDIDDNNGHVIIFYTRAVNEMTPPRSESVIGGFFHPRDLFPKTSTDPGQACATSNEAEMFYMLVPDPNGEVNENVREKEVVREGTVGVLGHELQHLINASRRLYVNNADAFEEVWLNEGLSHIAEELLFYSASGLAPRGNITYTQLVSSQTIRDAVNAYQVDNFGRLREHLENPEATSPFATNDELATRGATWQLLRYAADRSTRPQQAIWHGLANSRNRGITNFSAELGDFFPLVRDWAIAQYPDDVVAQLPATYQHPSWHYRSIIPRLGNPPTLPPYPLKTRTLVAGTPLSLTLNGGAAAYLRFGVGSNAIGTITPTSSGAAPPASVSFTVVRTK